MRFASALPLLLCVALAGCGLCLDAEHNRRIGNRVWEQNGKVCSDSTVRVGLVAKGVVCMKACPPRGAE